MGQLLKPPYEDYKNQSERWRRHQRQVERQAVAVIILWGLVLVVAILWVVAFGGS